MEDNCNVCFERKSHMMKRFYLDEAEVKPFEDLVELTCVIIRLHEDKQVMPQIRPCGRCREAVHSADGACRATGQIFHSNCFTCSSCCKMLTGEPFYAISGKIYCEDDFLYSGVHPKLEICSSCGHLISDNVLQACGTSYHPSCFRCVVCGQSLEDRPFSVDTDNKKVYCVSDYHKVKAPRCAACKMPILPTEGSTDCIRVVSLNRSFHVECFGSEVDLI